MSPEEKNILGQILKKLGWNCTVEELEFAYKRAFRTFDEWKCQNLEQQNNLPLEIKEMKAVARYYLLTALTGLCSPADSMSFLGNAVEAAYNLGKSNKSLSPSKE